MAIQWMDDFTSYGTDSVRVARLLNGPYAEQAWVDLVADPDPSAGGKYVLRISSNSSSLFRKALPSTITTAGVALRVWLTNLPSDATQIPWITGFSDINNNMHIGVTINPSGYIEVYRFDNGSRPLIGQSTNPVVIANAWRHYEVKVVIHASAGSVEVRQEGITILSITGIRTASNVAAAAASINNIRWQNERLISAGPDIHYKDLIVWDTSGVTNTNFMGSCQVYKIVPDGDVSLGWTPNSGITGWNKINETTPDDDSGYISAPYPVPLPSTFSMTDLPVNVTSVRGVQLFHRSRKTDGGDGQVQTSTITSGGTSNGSDRTISSAYTYWWDIFDQAPGSVGWTKALVDGMTMKINRTV